MTKKILDIFEKQAFGVFTWWGEKLGIKSQSIRLFFIYLSYYFNALSNQAVFEIGTLAPILKY